MNKGKSPPVRTVDGNGRRETFLIARNAVPYEIKEFCEDRAATWGWKTPCKVFRLYTIMK